MPVAPCTAVLCLPSGKEGAVARGAADPAAVRDRPQGGGTRYVDDRAVFTAIVYVLTTGCTWRHLPAEFGVSKATAHRRFVSWTEAGLWRRLHRAVLDRLGEQAAIDWSRAVVDAASARFGVELTVASGGRTQHNLTFLPSVSAYDLIRGCLSRGSERFEGGVIAEGV